MGIAQGTGAGAGADALAAPTEPAGSGLGTPDSERQPSRRLVEVLRQHDVDGERAIAATQGAIACFVLLLHVIAQLSKSGQFGNPWVILALGTLAGSSALRLHLVKAETLPERMLGALNLADIGIFLLLIWSYQFAYDHPPGGVLKAPSLALLFVLVALRALRFHPRPILMAGGAAVVGWAIVVLLAIVLDDGPVVTRNYLDYLTSYRVLIGAEVERLVALVALVLVLACAAHKARQLLSTSAHAADYAEALDAARRHLDEATQAKQKVEAALAEVAQRDAELSEQNRRFNIALANMSQGLCMFDKDKRLLVCNERYVEMYGLSHELAKPGTHFRQILEHRIRSGAFAQAPEQYIEERIKAVEEAKPSRKFQELNDGRVIAITHMPMPDCGWVATHDDITELRRIEARIVHMAHHDALTGLPNRTLLRDELTQALSEASRTGQSLAVLVLDLDRFKEVNDTLGHPVGDALLKQVGVRLGACVGERDVVARLGGDEFAVLQFAGDPAVEGAVLCRQIHEAIAAPFDLDGQHAVIGTSIGIALAPSDGNDPDELLKNADLALYRAKSDGPGQFRFFEVEMDQRMQARRLLERDLRSALANGEFEMHYQPVVNLERDEVSAFEALLRWHHPERGKIAPAEFIPLAEETGLIVPIGEWALRQACAEAAGWPRHIKVAVNVSAVQFKLGNLAQSVVSALASSGLAASRLELEITETALIQDSKSVLTTLRQLHDLGVRIALDDFGTGYSSLSYLRSFPFDKIKIDRSFIGDLTLAGEGSLAIVRSIARLGQSLGMETTAEGVETKGQLDLVRAEGCTEMQGYYFSEPRSAAEIARAFLPPPRASAGAA